MLRSITQLAAATAMIAALAVGGPSAASVGAIDAPGEDADGGATIAAISSLTFDPQHPAPGTNFTATGDGCEPVESIGFHIWYTGGGSLYEYHYTTDAAGGFSHLIQLPPVPPGVTSTEFAVEAVCGGYPIVDPADATIEYGTAGGDGPEAFDDGAVTAGFLRVDIDVLDNDDIGPDPTVDLSSAAPAHGTVSLAPDGLTVVYEPAAEGPFVDTFEYELIDAFGSDVGLVTVQVHPIDVGPVTTDEAVPATANVIPFELIGHAWVSEVAPGTNGTTAISDGGSGITFTPDPGFSGTETVPFLVANDSHNSLAFIDFQVAAHDADDGDVDDGDDDPGTTIDDPGDDVDAPGTPGDPTDAGDGDSGPSTAGTDQIADLQAGTGTLPYTGALAGAAPLGLLGGALITLGLACLAVTRRRPSRHAA